MTAILAYRTFVESLARHLGHAVADEQRDAPLIGCVCADEFELVELRAWFVSLTNTDAPLFALDSSPSSMALGDLYAAYLEAIVASDLLDADRASRR